MSIKALFSNFDRLIQSPESMQRLRQFILDLAVRGKLVPQDPNDEPASELLKRIGKKKRLLEKAGKIKKQKEIPPLTEGELPFVLPANWQWSQIAEIGLVSPRNEAADDVPASFIPMPMIPAEYGATCSHKVRQWGDIKKGYTHFAEGDIGLAKITPCFQNGKSVVFRNLTGGMGSGTTELHIVRPLYVAPDFIVLFLKCPDFIETGIPKMTGTAGQKRVPAEYFAHSPFPLPPLAEQRRIVAKVDELMVQCDRLEVAQAERETMRTRLTAASLARLNAPDPDKTKFQEHAAFAFDNFASLTKRPEQVKALRQTILNLAVRGKLVPQDPNDEPATELLKRIAKEKARLVNAGEIKKQKSVDPVEQIEQPFNLPSGWSLTQLAFVAVCLDYMREPINQAERTRRIAGKSQSLLFPYFGATQQQGWIDDYIFDEELVLLGEDGVPFFDPLRSKAYLISGKSWVNNHAHVFRGIFLSHPYLVHWLNTFDYSGRVVGATRAKLNQARAVDIPIMLPPLPEQHRIVAKVDELMTLCDSLEGSLATGDNVRRRLLDALLHEALELDGPRCRTIL